MMRLIKCFCVDAGDQHTPDTTMPVHWRERDWDHLREVVREHLGVQRHLAACGLLKFFDCPLIWSQGFPASVSDFYVEH
jgi:hypothetical protein